MRVLIRHHPLLRPVYLKWMLLVMATVVTPRDCSRCHTTEGQQFAASHHAKAGNILASLDNFLAETVEGARLDFNPHSPTMGVESVNGMASVNVGCKQCHGSKVTLEAKRARAEVNANVQESVTGIAVAKAFRQEQAIYDAFANVNTPEDLLAAESRLAESLRYEQE